MPFYFKEAVLPDAQYIKQVTEKKQIVLHFTAGGHNPLNDIAGWSSDPARIAAHNLIGGISTSNNETIYDGAIVKAFDSQYWSYHLGVSKDPLRKPRGYWDARSIAIEICNYGPLTKQANGTFKAWTGRVIPASMVLDLGFVFRGYQYYHKLTDKQLVAIEQVIRYHAKNHNIKLDAGRVFTRADFNFDIPSAQNKAVAFHVNYRTDGEKQDLPPDPRLIDMLNRLHATP